jgi:uncharacterized protein YbaP (TraB family)
MKPWILLAASLCATTVCAEENPMFAERPGTHGFLYEVHKPGTPTTLWVFGTIHVGTPTQTPFDAGVLRALAAVRQLALEADPSDLGGMARALKTQVVYPPDDSLDKHVSAATMTALRKVLPRIQLEEARVLRMRLWLVPMSIGLAEGQKLGLSGEYGTEIFLAAYAKTHALPIVELEGMEAQMALMSSEPEALQKEALDDTIHDAETGKGTEMLQRMVKAWDTGDVKVLDDIVKKQHASKRASEREFAKRLLDDRNVGMAEKAEGFLQGKQPTFLAVGCAHLFGDKGLLALLKKRGWEVTPAK